MIGPLRVCIAIATAALAIGALGGRTPFPSWSGAHTQQTPPTFTKDVAPIIFKSCASCHRPGGSAPFSLLRYEDVKGRAARIAAATRDRIMPPWKPEPGYGEFADERRLTGEEIATLQRWLDGGAVEGDAALLPALPDWSGQWVLGEPDLVLQTPTFTLRAGGDDVYRNFVLPVGTSGIRHIRAWQFLPGNAGVVHHSTMQFDPTGASRRLDAQDPEPGYEGLIPHTVGNPEGFFLGWLPGHTASVAPEGMAWTLPSKADLVMMLHLRPSGREERVQASLGLYFSDGPPRLHPMLVRLTRQHMDIPPGERRYVVTDSFRLDIDVDVYTVQPHAHYLATEVKSFATLLDGTRQWLIYIRDWDFHWQGVFRYARPQFLPAGTTITMEYTYDNSAQNPHNAHSPPRRVTYGQRTDEEMAELWLQVVPRNAAERPRLARAVFDRIAREDIVGFEKRLESDPRNVALHNDAALLHAEIGNLDRTAEHFAEVVRLEPDSAAALHNLGAARLRQGQAAAAADLFRKALSRRPDYALAHDSLGLVMHAAGQLDEAIEHYRQAVTLDPRDPDAQHHLAAALRSVGRLREAIPHYRRVLEIDPTRQAVRNELAEVERQVSGEPDRQR